jgi:hypothetical protein
MGFLGHQGGWVVKYFFRFLKASYASLVHWNLSYFFRSLKIGSPLMPSCEMNLLMAVIHPVNFYTSWRLFWWFHVCYCRHLLWVMVNPHRETIYLSNLSEGTPKVHFSRFNFILNFLRLSKVPARLEMSHSSS